MTLIDPSQDKFCQFLTAALEALCLLLEVTAFADIGKVCSLLLCLINLKHMLDFNCEEIIFTFLLVAC